MISKALTLDELINNFAVRGSNIAVIYNYESISYIELHRRVTTLACLIDSFQTSREVTKCAIIASNSLQWVITYLAIVYSGRIAVLLDPKENVSLLKSKLEYSDCHMVFYDNSCDVKKLKQQLKLINCWVCLKKDISSFNLQVNELMNSKRALNEKEICTIMFSSGTLNVPKAVSLSHKNIITVVNNIDDNITLGKKLLLVLPMHHCFGCFLGVMGTLNRGGVLYISKGPIDLYDEIMGYKPDTLLLVPALVRYLYNILNKKNKISNTTNGSYVKLSLRYLIVGGASLHTKYISEFEKLGITIYVGYGMTESSSLITVNNRKYNKIGSVGKHTTFCEVKIDSKTGEILIRGDNIISEYYKNSKTTNESFENMWLKTGDLGYIDNEGYLYITGRLNNLCVLDNGEKVCLEELEEHLQCIDLIDECLVEKGGTGTGKVIFKAKIWLGYENNTKENQIIVEKGIRSLNENLVDYKKIKNIEFFSFPLEKTNTGKLKRKIMEV
jgi:long-chain acyl-CoA synthetase